MRLFQPKCHCTAKLRQIRKSLNSQRRAALSFHVTFNATANVLMDINELHREMIGIAEKMECEICHKDKVRVPIHLADKLLGLGET